jgi:hypothetical protein
MRGVEWRNLVGILTELGGVEWSGLMGILTEYGRCGME